MLEEILFGVSYTVMHMVRKALEHRWHANTSLCIQELCSIKFETKSPGETSLEIATTSSLFGSD